MSLNAQFLPSIFRAFCNDEVKVLKQKSYGDKISSNLPCKITWVRIGTAYLQAIFNGRPVH
jgi:hypothetical protein